MSERALDFLTGTLILCGLMYGALLAWIVYEVTR